MQEMNSPGMTLVLADRNGIRRTVNYGFGDLEHKTPVGAEQLFEIGSISKSFVALCLLQLHDEDKLDLHKPITDYLPWFRIESKFAPIAADYAGTYQEQNGSGKLVVESSGDKLFVTRANGRFPLQPAGAPDVFVVAGGTTHFPRAFARTDAKDPKSKVVEASLGGEWYTTSAYTGPKQFTAPKEWHSYVGHYRNENPWLGSIRIVLRKGKLWVDGVTALELNGDRFSLRDEPHSPEYIQFGEIVNGRCQRLKFSGEDMWRMAA